MNILLVIYIIVYVILFYFLCNKLEYWANILIYMIFMGVIPLCLTYTKITLIPELLVFNSFWGVIMALLFRFIIGRIYINLLAIINDHFQNIIYFFIAGAILEMSISCILFPFTMRIMDSIYVKTFAVTFIILYIIYQAKNAQYNELFGSHFGNENDSPMHRMGRFFFGRWF